MPTPAVIERLGIAGDPRLQPQCAHQAYAHQMPLIAVLHGRKVSARQIFNQAE